MVRLLLTAALLAAFSAGGLVPAARAQDAAFR